MAVTNADILGWLNANPGADAALINQTMAEAGVSAAQYQDATGTPPPTAVTNLKQQILSQNTTDKWTGEGFGSAQANAEAMAKRLADAGITDIKQFGKVDKYEPVDVIGKTYNGNRVYQTGADEYGNGGGSYYYSKPTGETDYEGNPIYQTVTVPQGAKLDNLYGVADVYGESYNPIDPSKVVVRDGVPTTVTGQTFGNKVTGEAIESGSGRWQNQGGEGLFSGTGEGKGNTAFRAEFAPDGTPIFYTTQGSSSDVSKGLMTALSLAAGYFAPGVGNALLGAGANQIAAGALGGSLLGGGLAAATGQNVLKGALTGGIGGAGSAYLGNAFGDTAAGFGPQTDASFLAADAAQLAKQGISQSQIVDILSSSGYGSTAAANLAASMAVNGLDVGAMTDQLNNLSSNTGLMSQTGSSADFLAADALQLQGQVGNNFAAIEQNLIASGVDPLIAADVSQQLAFNPGLTQAQLATNLSNSFGNNIYDVNMAATYPTSVLPGSGGLLSDVAGVGGANTSTGAVTSTGSGASTTATGSGSGLTTSQIANLATAGLNVAGILGVTSALSGGTGGSRSVGALPTQGVPLNTADYFNAIQQNYNRLLPAVPRDVATPLAQWYNSQYGA